MTESNGIVIPLGNVTRLDIPADRVLEAAKGELKGCVVLGYDHEGNSYCASSLADGGEVIWLLRYCEKLLFEGAE